MMNERRRTLQTVKVDHYDGQSIYSNNELIYELGGYLGGGAAGVYVVHFLNCKSTYYEGHVAIKILNPVGYKLLPSALLARCIVAIKGKPLDAASSPDQMPFERHNNRNSSASSSSSPMRIENVWWLIHPTTKQAIAAFEDPRTGMIRELTLPQCIEIWGSALNAESALAEDPAATAETYQEVEVKNQVLKIPKIPKKFIKFAYTRRSIHREISNMSGLDFHENVLRFDEALELVQDSKCTTFLVLELAAGGELFDRIKLDCGTDEATARRYFRQLISGVAFCHSSGICHRDLKPENLLLADTEEHSTLKIADFGLSAIFSFTDSDNTDGAAQCIRRLRSVVGSPHYVAPEVLMDAGQGYDGAKADAWSIGVILYAMIAGNLPFGKDLLKCLRYDKFRKWSYNTKYSDDDPTDEVIFPSWFFPQHFTLEVKSLIAQLLYPDPCMRLAVEEAQHHPWVLDQLIKKSNPISINDSSPPLNSPNAMSSPLVTPPSYKNRSNVAVNIPQNTLEQEHRWGNMMTTPRSGITSPHSFSRPLGLSMCPPSPQKSARPIHLVGGGGYMPCVDEESSPLSGQTPPTSPRNNCNLERNDDDASTDTLDKTQSPNLRDVESAVCLQFDFEHDDGGEDRVEPMDEFGAGRGEFAESQEEDENADEVDCLSEELSSSLSQQTEPAAASSTSMPTSREVFRRFISPPLAIESRGSMFHRSNQHRRNSPPELYLSRFEKSAKLEEIRPFNLELLDLNFSSSSSLSSTPTGESHLSAAMTPPASSSFSSSPSLNDPMPAADPPTCNDHVARSTRFMTALPAQLVLSKIETILAANPSPLPYPYKNVPQRVTIDWANYQLEVCYGSMLTCTVQVFLYQRGVYLVEFRRGQVEIFQFKRFYEDIRAKISESMASSSQQDSLHPFRKRNKSICVNDEF